VAVRVRHSLTSHSVADAYAPVLILAPQPFLEDRGTPIATFELAKALIELGHEVDVLTFPMGRHVELPGLRVFRVSNPFFIRHVPIGFSVRKVLLDLSMAVAMRRMLKRRDYAAVHAVEESAFLAVIGRRAGVPVIYDMASSIPEQLARTKGIGGRVWRGLLNRCERWLLGRVDRVVCSRGLAEKVRAAAPGKPVHEWVFLPVNAANAVEATDLRERLRIADATLVAVYAGSFAPYQGLDELLRAVPEVVKSARNFHLLLVGADASSRSLVERLARDLGVAGHVTVLERQPRETIPGYLALADVLVLPRGWGSNVPLKLFDYRRAGKPIVSSIDSAHELTEANAGVVRVEHTPQALAKALIEILVDDAARQKLTIAACASVGTSADHGEYLRLVGDLYQGLGPPVDAIRRVA